MSPACHRHVPGPQVARHGMYADLLSRTHATNKIHVLDTETMTWSKPNVAGTLPLPRYRHSTVMHGSQLYCYGGFGGGAELHVLDTGIMDEAVLERDAAKRRKVRERAPSRYSTVTAACLHAHTSAASDASTLSRTLSCSPGRWRALQGGFRQ